MSIDYYSNTSVIREENQTIRAGNGGNGGNGGKECFLLSAFSGSKRSHFGPTSTSTRSGPWI